MILHIFALWQLQVLFPFSYLMVFNTVATFLQNLLKHTLSSVNQTKILSKILVIVKISPTFHSILRSTMWIWQTLTYTRRLLQRELHQSSDCNRHRFSLARWLTLHLNADFYYSFLKMNIFTYFFICAHI